MDRFLWMNCFARAVETGSFSAVARELGIGQPNVSRYIAALERHLGSRLLHRSTRKLTLTPEGERYYIDARQVLDAVSEAESNARSETQPSGLLRVSCPTSLGRDHLLPLIRPLLERHPGMEMDLQISDRFADLVEEGLDAALRIGTLRDSALRARPIGSCERVCVASAAYLGRRGVPRTPAQLLQHDCIVYTLLASGSSWIFRDGEVPVSGRFRVNTPDGVYRAALDGLGIAYAPIWLFAQALLDQRLELVLLDHLGPAAPIQIVYSSQRLLPRRAAVFMDYIADEFSRDPMLNQGALARLLERGATVSASPTPGNQPAM